YRAAVRGKVEGIRLREPETTAEARARVLPRAQAHWLLAVSALEVPARRPALILLGGLPGTGKSTLARGLTERTGGTVIRTDVVRKDLAGQAPSDRATAEYAEGIYTPEWTAQT